MIEIYGAEGCLYCNLAREYLDGQGIDYTYIDVGHDTEAMKMFREHSFKTVPQIFVDNEHIGGYTELKQVMQRVL